MSKTGYLVLENGKIFRGERFGATGEVTAEVVFATGMTGYLETLTDPGYFGQIVAQTFPLIGNYGVISADFESDFIGPKAYIVKHWCQEPSNFRSEGSLDTFFEKNNIVALAGVDTRSLTKLLREAGVMNGIITDDPDSVDLEALKAYRVKDAVNAVTTKERYVISPEGEVKKRVAMLDFGLKKAFYRELLQLGAEITVCPASTTAAELKELAPDGIILSNGPGDPAENAEIVANVKEICKLNIPVFGIGLGHQLLAMAHGAGVTKMKHGHRGSNQPVKNLETGKIFTTSQNHGYAVETESLPRGTAQMWFRNVNDGTCEGLRYTDCPAFGVQFYPAGKADSVEERDLYTEFFNMMSK